MLLSLPKELLLDIIGYVATIDECDSNQTAKPDPDPPVLEFDCSLPLGVSGTYPSDPEIARDPLVFWPNSSFRLRSYSNITALSHTCQLLRSLCAPVKYHSVVSNYKTVPVLYKLLKSRSYHIAACIRHLTLSAPYDNTPSDPFAFYNIFPLPSTQPRSRIPDSPLLPEILESCTKLQELWLDGTGWEDHQMLLGHLAPESKQSITALGLSGLEPKRLFGYLQALCDEVENGGFGALTTVRIGAAQGNKYETIWRDGGETVLRERQLFLQSIGAGWAGGRLESVRTFTFGRPSGSSMELAGGLEIMGEYFAMLMPNVQVLNLNTTVQCIYGALSTYAKLGSKLTELTLSSKSRTYINFCDVLAELSPRVTKFVVRGSWLWICQRFFGAGGESLWPNLTLLSVGCFSGCNGIELSDFRAGLERLTQTHPTTYMFMNEQIFGGSLVSWNRTNESIHCGVTSLARFWGLMPENLQDLIENQLNDNE